MFTVIAPPLDEKKLAEVGKEVLEAAQRLGFQLHAEGFARAWLEGTLVLAERDDETKEIVGMCVMACGHRWLADDEAGNIMLLKGRNEEGLIDFAINIASARGAGKLYVERGEPVPQDDGTLHRCVVEYQLR